MSGLEYRHRGAKLVRDIGDKIEAELILAGERIGHRVESNGEVAGAGGGGGFSPPLASFWPLPRALVTSISRVTGRLMRRATPSATISASTAAIPAAAATARQRVARSW